MRGRSLLDRYLLMNPLVKGTLETALLLLAGWLGRTLSIWKVFPARPLLKVGMGLVSAGMAIHGASHAAHKQAHRRVEEIDRLATTGIYAYVRHPGYLGIILVHFGLACFFGGTLLPFLFAALSAASFYLTALREERALLERFGREYEDYMRRVRWRFIPGLL